MVRSAVFGRWLVLAVLVAGWGCSRGDQSATATLPETSAAALEIPPDDELRTRIDAILDFSSNARNLNSRDHAAWQIVHGLLQYGRDFQIEHEGKLVGALDYLTSGGKLTGWNLRKGSHGVVALLEAGSKTGQGHPDQWLGYLSQCGLGIDDKLVVAGEDFTVRDLVTQAQWDIHDGMEASWTLMACATYLPLDTKWTAKDGSEWTIPRMAEMEAKAGFSGVGCGGTHRAYGLVVALNKYLEAGGDPDQPQWNTVYDAIYGDEGVIAKSRQYQQPDGNFSTQFFDRAGSSANIETRIHATGHTLEVLAAAMDKEELEQLWVTNGVVALLDMLERTQDYPLECGALYHAVRGLDLYRTRRFGPRESAVTAAK
jgi:hypothetical protein